MNLFKAHGITNPPDNALFDILKEQLRLAIMITASVIFGVAALMAIFNLSTLVSCILMAVGAFFVNFGVAPWIAIDTYRKITDNKIKELTGN